MHWRAVYFNRKRAECCFFDSLVSEPTDDVMRGIKMIMRFERCGGGKQAHAQLSGCLGCFLKGRSVCCEEKPAAHETVRDGASVGSVEQAAHWEVITVEVVPWCRVACYLS